jgi:hypothetical protein
MATAVGQLVRSPIMFLPARQRGEVAPSYGVGGVMGRADAVAHDPSAPAGHLPGFAREENAKATFKKSRVAFERK